MADGVQFSIAGLDSLLGKLDAVSYDMKRKGGRAALRKAAQVLRDAARANAARVDDSSTSEKIADNIVERWNGRRFKRTGDLGFRIGVLGGARATGKDAERTARRRKPGQSSLEDLGEIAGAGKANPGGDTFYWRFLEFGTSRAPARPFMRPAMDSSTGATVDAFVNEYEKAIDRAIQRAKKKAGVS